MKHIIVLLLFAFFVSCSDDSALNSNPLQIEGEIIEVTRIDSTVFVRVEIKNSSSRLVSLWFYGSDTCKIGQKLKLQ
jgi:hypothetical protein